MHTPPSQHDTPTVSDRPPRPATRVGSITRTALSCSEAELLELEDLPSLHNLSISSFSLHDSWAVDLSSPAGPDKPPRIVTRIKSVDDEAISAASSATATTEAMTTTTTESPSTTSSPQQQQPLPPLPPLPQIQLPARPRGDLPPRKAIRLESCGAAPSRFLSAEDLRDEQKE